jgi:hypothetical protein
MSVLHAGGEAVQFKTFEIKNASKKNEAESNKVGG